MSAQTLIRGGVGDKLHKCPKGRLRKEIFDRRWAYHYRPRPFYDYRELKIFINWTYGGGSLNAYLDYSASGTAAGAGFRVTGVISQITELEIPCECIRYIPCWEGTVEVREVVDQPWPIANTDDTTPVRFRVCADGTGPFLPP